MQHQWPVCLHKLIICFDFIGYFASIPVAEWEVERAQTSLEHTNRLRSVSSARVTAAAFPLLSNLTLIHSKISKSKPNFWQDQQDQICLLGIHLLWESLKRTTNDSQTDYQFQWVKVSKCNICLVGACLCIHVQLSAHPEVTKTHTMNKIPLEPSVSIDMDRIFHSFSNFFFFFFLIWLTEGAIWVTIILDYYFFKKFWWCKNKEEEDGKYAIGIYFYLLQHIPILWDTKNYCNFHHNFSIKKKKLP